MPELQLIPRAELERVQNAALNEFDKLSLLAAMCRANTLAEVKRAGSGHLGSSFSAMDIVIWLYYHEMNVTSLGIDHPDRDVYFSSKGHDVPGLYSVLYALGIVPQERLLKLRRLGGLDGHPDVGIPGIEANSGSLGMGVSKGRGIAWAKRTLGRGGRVFVMLGDGELQEGQNYEALRSTVNQGINELTVIVDHNKLQSDKLVSEIGDLGALGNIFQDFGWYVARYDGHDWQQLQRVFAEFANVTDKPKVLIADTIKGRGVSFMEHPVALEAGQGYYKWHSGAPDDASFEAGYREMIEGINAQLSTHGLRPVVLEKMPPLEVQKSAPVAANALGEPVSTGAQTKFAEPRKKVSDEYVAVAYGEALVDLAPQHPEIVVLDGDLSADCKVRGFELQFPERFIEVGIAEQDMVSMAGGLARHGMLPVVNSFSNFLAARANEQIYNNATEKSKIIYACHYAGLIPAGPGKSHQSIRDISLLGALPNMTIIQPCNAQETRAAVEYCVKEAKENCALRLVIGPSPRLIELSADYEFTVGRGAALTQGSDGVLFAYGPVMLHEAMLASESLRERGYTLKVVNMPWLNRIDVTWLGETIGDISSIFVLEDHAPVGGLGDRLLDALVSHRLLGARSFEKFAVEGFPACGTPAEALQHHRLNGLSLADRIAS
jgi:transketolase